MKYRVCLICVHNRHADLHDLINRYVLMIAVLFVLLVCCCISASLLTLAVIESMAKGCHTV